MKLIAIAGVARSGKDTLCQMLIDEFASRGLKAKRFALADELKKELYPFIMENFGVDVYTMDGEIKEIIRPILVAHGGARRKLSKGKYWTGKMDEKLAKEDCDVAIITDCRYTDYGDEDEIGWVKNKGGILIHIQRLLDGGGIQPAPNEDERRNDPLLLAEANIRLLFGSLTNDDWNNYAKLCVKEIVDSCN
jgi:hypothetical protein